MISCLIFACFVFICINHALDHQTWLCSSSKGSTLVANCGTRWKGTGMPSSHYSPTKRDNFQGCPSEVFLKLSGVRRFPTGGKQRRAQCFLGSVFSVQLKVLLHTSRLLHLQNKNSVVIYLVNFLWVWKMHVWLNDKMFIWVN